MILMMIYWNRNKKGGDHYEKNIPKTNSLHRSFFSKRICSCLLYLACRVGSGETNPVTHTIWPSNSRGEEEHLSSGTGNCSDAGSNYLTVDSNGNFRSLEEWRSDLNNNKGGWLHGTKVAYEDLSGDGKCGPGDYIAWNTSTSDGKRTWHHWGIAKVADAKHPNHS